MRLQVLASGSGGNSTLVRAGEQSLLVDAGLGPRDLAERFAAAGVGPKQLDHVLVTHAHLDHSRSAGVVAKRQGATLHATHSLLRHRALARCPRLGVVPVGGTLALDRAGGLDPVHVRAVALPHDSDPTVAYRIEHGGRVAVILTDMGRPDEAVARQLAGAHLLMLEFNHCPALMETSIYPPALRRRIGGDRGHLSNQQAARMLRLLAWEGLTTLVLAHLSLKTNTPERALEAAHGALAELGLAHVAVHVAAQHEVGPSLAV